ncbi:MAG TPA: SGNH family hydrolase [Beijerinckiaceae bacterium]|jgi:hypothetical protein
MRRTTLSWSGRFGLGLKLAAASVLVLATAGPAAEAQFFDESNPNVFWRMERERQQLRRPPQARQPRVVQRPTHLIRGAAPRRGYVRELPGGAPEPHDDERAVRRATPEAAPAPSPAADPPAPAVAEPAPVAAPAPETRAAEAPPPAAPAPAFTIAVLGDNVGQMLAQGLQEAYAERAEAVVLRRARENTGLVREDYYDWAKAARDLLAGEQRVDVGVMMIGSNDRQALRDGATSVDVRAPRWKEVYADRVRAVGQAFKDKNTPLVWVGMPVMKNERLSAGLLEQNEIIRDVAGALGQTYVDVWEAFVDDRHQFALYGPDVNGQTTKLRTGDGVHFTRAGARKLAHFVEGDIKRLMEERQPRRQPEAAPVAAAPAPAPGEADLRVVVPTSAAPPGSAPPAAEMSPQLAIPLPPPAPNIVIPVRRAAGPVVPLTGAAVSPGGRLAEPSRTAASSDDEARRLVEQALVQGRPLDPRAGRADDFRWPRD